MYKTVLLFALLFVVRVFSSPLNTKPVDGKLMITLEEACVTQGGLCVLPEECDPSSIPQIPNLCPLGHSIGAVCCYL